MLKVVKISDQGTVNPIVARLGMGISDIVNVTSLTEKMRNEVDAACFECMTLLLEAEKAARPLMDEIRALEKRLAMERFSPDTSSIEIPGVMNLNNCRVFLKFAKQALQRLAKTMGELLGKDFKGPHFDKIEQHAFQTLGDGHVVTKLLREDQAWLKELNDLRAEDEHPKSGKPFVCGFDVNPLPDGRSLINVPRFYNNAPVLNRLEIYSQNLLTFTEEMLVFTAADHLPYLAHIFEIPAEQRDPTCPIRFRIGLKINLP